MDTDIQYMGLESFSKSSSGQTEQSSVNDLSESNIYRIILGVASEHGNDFTKEEMSEYTDGLHPNTIKKHTGKTLNELKDHLGLVKNSRHDITEQEIKECLKNIERPITKRKVDKKCDFSSATVKNKYGNGSFVDGLIHFGVEPTKEQLNCRDANVERNNNSKSSYRYCSNLITTHPNYDKNADAYLYTLNANRLTDGEEFTYVGQVGKDSSLVSRIYSHYVKNGNFNGVKKLNVKRSVAEEIEMTDSKVEFNIELRNIYPLYQFYLDDSEFKKYIDRAEFRKMLEVAIDRNTTNVLGGV